MKLSRISSRLGIGHCVVLVLLIFWVSQISYFTQKYKENSEIAEQKTVLQLLQTSPSPADGAVKPSSSTIPPVPPRSVFNSQWINLTLSDRTVVHLYSAYQDYRGRTAYVRVMGLAPHRFKKKLICILEDVNGYQLSTEVVIRENNENWNLPWASHFFSCIMKENFKPDIVTLVREGEEANKESGWIKVIHTHPMDRNQREILTRNLSGLSVCVKPLHNFHDRALWFMEFIEFYKILGASHFYLYNHSVGTHLEPILRHYVERRELTLLPWQLPVQTIKKIRNEGQFTALNDCTYRSMFNHKYTALVDVDEYLVPHQHDDLYSLLNQLDQKSIGSFVFQNSFFYLYWENATISGEGYDIPYLITQFKTRRLTKLHKHGIRSKYIVKPDQIIEVGNHVVWEHISGSKSFKIEPSYGSSHHYRICEFGGFDCLKEPSQVDNTTHRWQHKLIQNIQQTCTKVFGEGGCPPAPPLGNPW